MRNIFKRKLSEVTQESLQQLIKTYPNTPDLCYLQTHARQNIFIADDLKMGKVNHDLIFGHKPVHPTCYTLETFNTWVKDLGGHSFPLPFKSEINFDSPPFYKPEPARLRGELYTLPSHLFWKVLDIHKQNLVQFVRERVSITLPWREISYSTAEDASYAEKIPRISKDQLRTIRAWMYVANPEYWSDMIGSYLGSRAVEIYEHETPKVWIDKYADF